MHITRSFFAMLAALPLCVTLFCNKQDKNTEPAGAVALQETVLRNNLTYPWEICWGPDNFIWMTERGGRISRLNPTTGDLIPVSTISEVVSRGEGGLLGLTLHPQFNTNPYVYVVYNYEASGGAYREKIVRYSYNGNTLVSPKTILDNIAGAGIHNGSRLLIVSDKLFVSTGDASNTDLSQTLSSVNGKILRYDLDGSIPVDNPVAGNPYWSSGHRNAQGLVFANNKLYSSEHGPGNDDEINIIEKGANYGWPDVQGYCNTSSEQSYCGSHIIKEPIRAWTPTIAPSGMDYYNSDLIPQWKNSLLLATLKDSRLYQLKLGSDNSSIVSANEYFTNSYGRLRDLCISPDGRVFICTSNGNNDKVIEITKRP